MAVEPALYFSDVPKATRDALAEKGQALPDGSYPIADRAHLHSAIVLAQSGHGDVAAAKTLIKRRAKELNAEDMLPDNFSDQPDASDVHVNGMVNDSGGTAAALRPTRHFLTRMMDKLKGKVSPEEFDEAVRHARAYAGGMTSSANRSKMPMLSVGVTGMSSTYDEWDDQNTTDSPDISDIPESVEEAVEAAHPKLEKSAPTVKYRDGTTLGECCSDCKFYEGNDEHECVLVEGTIRPNGVCNLFTSNWEHAQQPMSETPAVFSEPLYYMEPPEWIPYLPKPGSYKHPSYGQVLITPERNQRFIDNFKNRVYQDELPIDAEHQSKLSGACGYVTDMRMNGDSSVDARPRWTDRGTALLAADRFTSFSPEFFDQWTDPATGQNYKDVAIGGALTTRPFFKSKSLRPLAASEHLMIPFFGAREEQQRMAEDKSKDKESKAEDKAEAADDEETEEGTVASTEPRTASKSYAEKFDQLERQNAALKEMTERQDTESKRMAEVISGMERTARAKQFTDEVLGRGDASSARWYGSVEDHVSFMETLHGAGLDEQLKQYIEQQRTHAEQLRTSGLFSERGRAGTAGSQTSGDKLETLIAAKEAEGKSKLEATELVMSENPQLYAEYSEAQSFRDGD